MLEARKRLQCLALCRLRSYSDCRADFGTDIYVIRETLSCPNSIQGVGLAMVNQSIYRRCKSTCNPTLPSRRETHLFEVVAAKTASPNHVEGSAVDLLRNCNVPSAFPIGLS